MGLKRYTIKGIFNGASCSIVPQNHSLTGKGIDNDDDDDDDDDDDWEV